MSAGLIAILLVFVAMMAAVLFVCLRGRRKVTAAISAEACEANDEADDNRVAVVFFVAILAGAGLAIAAAMLLFFLPQ